MPEDLETEDHVTRIPIGIKPHMVGHRQVNRTKYLHNPQFFTAVNMYDGPSYIHGLACLVV